MNKFILALAAATLLPSGVKAADWTGPFVGLNAAYVDGRSNFTYRINDTKVKGSKSGSMVGLQGGYNWQSGNLVVGLAAEGMPVSGLKTSALCPSPDWRGRVELKDLYSIQGRLGGVVGSQDILIYGTIGLASGRLKVTTLNTATDSSFGDTHRHDGWVAGLGVAGHINQHWTWGAECSRVELAKKNYVLDNGLVVKAKATYDTFKMGVGYLF